MVFRSDDGIGYKGKSKGLLVIIDVDCGLQTRGKEALIKVLEIDIDHNRYRFGKPNVLNAIY